MFSFLFDGARAKASRKLSIAHIMINHKTHRTRKSADME